VLLGAIISIVDLLIDTAGSVIPPSELGDSDYIAGRWVQAFSTDPKATIFGSLGRGVKLQLDIKQRKGRNEGTVEEVLTFDKGKPGIRGQGLYSVAPSGRVNIRFTQISTVVFGMEVPAPSFLTEGSSSSITTSYFDGKLWIERLPGDLGSPPV
jgi:hypothetical protein